MFNFTPYYDPLTPLWDLMANSMFYFWYFCHYQKGCIPGSVCILLPALTYVWWYIRLPLVHFEFESAHRVYPGIVPIAEVLT